MTRSVWRRFAVAALVSGVVHAGAIALGRIDLPQAPAELPPLAVRVEHAAPPPPVRLRAPRVARAEAPHVPAIPVIAAPRGAERMETPALQPDGTPSGELPAPAAETEPVVVATAPPSTLAPPAPALPAFPRSGQITFSIVYGRDGFPVARTVQSWKIDGERYQLASRSETVGIVDLFRSQHRTYVSRGELTAGGLRPETFLMSRDRGRGAEEARVRFDWGQGRVTLGPATAQREQALPGGSQDILSFMYQLALAPPPPGRTRVAVTNGTRLETYELDVLPEERIETPLGLMRALPIRHLRAPGTEGVDIWLATEYRHLPVRMRFYGRDGEPTGEHVVTEIRLSD